MTHRPIAGAKAARALLVLTLGLVLALLSPAEPTASATVGATEPPGEPPAELWLRNVRVLPMTRPLILLDRDVRVSHGAITGIEPAGDADPPKHAEVVAGRGCYLLPGLIDAHVHINDEVELLSYLAHGVTTVVNLRGSEAHLQLAEDVASGARLGPRIYTSGPTIDGDPPVWGGSNTTVVTSAAEAREAVEGQMRAGYHLLKVYNNLDPASLGAVVDAAAEHELAVVGHVPRKPDRATALPKALDAGMAMIAHGEEIFFTHLLGDAPDATVDEGPWEVDAERVREAVRMLKEAGAAVTPNLSFIAMTERMLDDLPSVLEHPESRYLGPDTREMWRRYNPTTRDNLELFAAREEVKGPVVRRLTRELEQAGVPLLLGTDASTPGLYPGWSAILELEELVGAGLSPYRALVAGTRAAGELLERHVADAPAIGTIDVGSAADLVLVCSNPLDDPGVLRDPEGVVAAGRWLSRERLEALRSRAAKELPPAD